ncbi:OmpH family outer membrane protein [Poseidonocella sp. HB161398]|uniref:OmpH family outer membrane protein n=1 Tax=Poseidonocella sp. HB161398 TaxID=2320855 RepID=UPI0011089114|nr:OmpH family outer membrane protein [Poseidonocella sp. HB161398]
MTKSRPSTSRSRRRSSAVLLAAALCASAAAASAQEAGETGAAEQPGAQAAAGAAAAPQASDGTVVSPVLTLNQDAMFTQSALGKRIVADLERDRNALAQENRRIEAELTSEEQELTDKRPVTPPDDFAKLAADFDEKVQQLRQEQDRKARALQQRLEAERQNFVSRAAPILAEIAQERGALVILDNTVVLMAFDVVDVTDEAVARLDKEIGNGASSFGPAEPSPALRPTPRMLRQTPVPDGGAASGSGD